MKRAEKVTFGGGGLDRAAHLRGGDMGDLLADPETRVLPLWRGKPLLRGTAGGLAPGLLTPDHPVLAAAGDRVLLGLEHGAPRFAADLSGWQPDELPETLGAFTDPSEQTHPDLGPTHLFRELRASMMRLSALDAEICATGRAILEWHRTHPFCARCGSASVQAQAGWQRICPTCGASHFPRTDPVVIMLITHGNDVLVGRSPLWPDRMFSLLAGFVEPGETIEAAVRREVLEETQVRVAEVSYLASQPWPFPASLMIGCHGHATSREITVDPVEIEEARWLSREDLMQALAGGHPEIAPAREGAIARFLLSNWLADTLD